MRGGALDPWISELSAQQCLQQIGYAPAVLIRIVRTQGSTPREQGCWMMVTQEQALNTIGGGHLEFEAIGLARSLIDNPDQSFFTKEFKLGPSLGQCCGGAIQLEFHQIPRGPDQEAFVRELVRDADYCLSPVALVGGGHVGHAIVQALLPLPFRIHWIDSREGIFPQGSHDRLRMENFDDAADCTSTLDPASFLLIMSFTHAEDLEVVRTALLRRRKEPTCFPFIGLIGSNTKWARFRHRLLDRGLSERELNAVTCPIGLPGIQGKEPAVIAASVAAQLLICRAGSGLSC